jgi:hypothetical protein
MIDTDALASAIEIQQKSYRLLRWVAEAIDNGRMPARFATRHAEGPEAAVEWVRQYHDGFPRDVRVDSKDLEALANFFWTYVVTSFDVVSEPGSRGAFGTTGCICELCVRLVDASHLKTKKLRAHDKRRALALMTARTVSLGAEHGIVIDEGTATSYLDDPDLRRAMGYSAYGKSLLERLRGETEGPAVLALWREIAWTRTGAPIKDFRLDVDDFVASEQHLLDVMRHQ